MHRNYHWFELGEPTDDGIEATITITYDDPERDTQKVEGRVGEKTVQMLEDNEEIWEHTHNDGSVLLDMLSDDVRASFLDEFERIDRDENVEIDLIEV